MNEIARKWWVEEGRCHAPYACESYMDAWRNFAVIPNTIARIFNSIVEEARLKEVRVGENGAFVKSSLNIDYENEFAVRVRKWTGVDIMAAFKVRGEDVLPLDSEVTEDAINEFEREHNWQREFRVKLAENLIVQVLVWEETEEVDEHIITWDGFDVYVGGVREEIASEVGAIALALGLFYFSVESFLQP